MHGKACYSPLQARKRRLSKKPPAGRLVAAIMTPGDLDVVERLKGKIGSRSRASAVRFALRQLASFSDSQSINDLCVVVRREACFDTKEHKAFIKRSVRVPVNLDDGDSVLLESAKRRYELDSFAQVIRLSLRAVDA